MKTTPLIVMNLAKGWHLPINELDFGRRKNNNLFRQNSPSKILSYCVVELKCPNKYWTKGIGANPDRGNQAKKNDEDLTFNSPEKARNTEIFSIMITKNRGE